MLTEVAIERRAGHAAKLNRLRAARLEGAADWLLPQRRRDTGNAAKFAVLMKAWHTIHERLRVWVARAGQHFPYRPDLHEPPCVHHSEGVNELGHEADIVPNENEG